MKEVALGNIMVDCGDEKSLQAFYGQMLNWESCVLFGRPAVRSAGGVVLLFCQEEDYVPPVWPEQDGCQQKQMHFDFQVESVPEAVEKALRLGAVKAPAQYGGEEFVTMLDPAGHPFCLCRKAEKKAEKNGCAALIRRVNSPEEKRRISREILESLPEWFGIPEARETYIAESAGQTFFAAPNITAAPPSAISSAHSLYAGSTAHSTANTSAAAYHGRTLGFVVRITLLMGLLLSRRGGLPLVPFHNKSFSP